MSTLGKVLAFLCAGILYVLTIYAFFTWFGIWAAIAALVIPPIAVLIPIIYITQFGVTPQFLIITGIWVLGLIGAIMATKNSNEEKRNENFY